MIDFSDVVDAATGSTEEVVELLTDQDSDDEDDDDYVGLRLDTVTLRGFLKDGIKKIEKRPFREIESELQVGDQIWIYRDRRSNPCNPVVLLMPYVHLAVFVGIEDGKKKVVHVTKASFLYGINTATIRKDSISNVINQNDRGRTKMI